MKVYKVAIIGCGQMGNVHAEQIYFKPNLKITYACDNDIEKAKLFALKYNAENISANPEECISNEDTDIVIIATYPSAHLPLLKLCLKYGKHVICEKPIATNLEDGKEFVRLVKEHNECKVLIGHILRHNKTYQRVAQMIKNDVIGHPIIMRMSQNHHTLNWQRYLALINETSPMIDCGVHYFDIMHWFTGAEVESVSGIGMRTDDDVPKNKYNYELITAQLSDGSVGFYEAGWTKTISSDNQKEFIGPKGSIRIVYRKDRQTHQEEGDLIEHYNLEDNTYHTINVIAERKPTDLQFDYLIGMIEKNIPAFPSIDDVFKSFTTALNAEAAIKLSSG